MVFLFNALAILAVCATALMHWLGVEYSLYWTYAFWWDIPTHILGGLTVGFWAAAVSTRMQLSQKNATIFIFGLALAVGAGWEFWETLEDLSGGVGGYWFDTFKDICDDLLGALIAWTIFKLSYRKAR